MARLCGVLCRFQHYLNYITLRRFQHYLNYIKAASTPILMFLEFLLPVFRAIFFPSHWLFSHMINVETMVSSGRGMNPVAVTIIKKKRPSQGMVVRDRTLDLLF